MSYSPEPFQLLGWQEKIVRDMFGTIKADGYCQFTTAYVETPRKAGQVGVGYSGGLVAHMRGW